MKRFLILAILCFGFLPVFVRAQTEPVWNQKLVSNPLSTYGHSLVYDTQRQEAVLFGGAYHHSFNFDPLQNRTWVWNGQFWAEKNPIHVPLQRIYSALAYDTARQETVLFGGQGGLSAQDLSIYNPNLNLGDTWVWDGNDWIEKLPNVSPLSRRGQAMAYDQARRKTVLFGGVNDRDLGAGLQSDTWTWDGNNWQQQFPTASPSGRWLQAMAYDQAREQVVLFGGFDASDILNDTWVWDGQNWNQLNPPHKPEPRIGHKIVYDQRLQKIILFGGQTANGLPNDIWLWDGQDWTQIQTQSGPTSGFFSGLAYDPIRNETLLYAGIDIPTQTWTLKFPEPQGKRPVLIIPGILGSWEKDGQWVIDPILHKYDDLIRLLQENGYSEDINLFTFPYDWKQDILLTSQQLEEKIQDIKPICQCEKIDIIAHSLGGLVARAYTQGNNYQNDINQIIFLGTPHEGSSFAYLLWEGGEITPQFLPTNFDRTLEYYLNLKSITSFAGSRFTYIRNYVLSIQDLLPIYSYLKEDETGFVRPYPDNYPVNLTLELLNSSTSENRLAERGIKIVNIVGNIEPNFINSKLQDTTLGNIRVVNDPSRFPKWEHGYPENYDNFFGDHGLEFTEGDRRVSTQSANHAFPSTIISHTDRDLHSKLPTIAWPQIQQALLGTTTSSTTTPITIEESLIIPILSPADIQVIDPLGRKIGKDFSTGQEINEIPLAFYSGLNNDLELVAIPNPINGSYQIQIQGTGTGTYEVQTAFINDSTSSISRFNANIEPGLLENLVFSFNASEPQSTVIEPEDTEPPIISHTEIPNEIILNSQPIVFNFSAIDNLTGVFNVSATLDGQPLQNGSDINFDTPGKHAIEITAQDFVGNTSIKTIDFNVIYQFSGYLPPIETNGSGVYKLGRTIPVKFQLTDINNTFIPTAIAQIFITKISNGILGTTETLLSTTNHADSGNTFRYDSENNQYIYNFSTNGLSAGTWELRTALDDGKIYSVIISLK